jgi:hypothetical protein
VSVQEISQKVKTVPIGFEHFTYFEIENLCYFSLQTLSSFFSSLFFAKNLSMIDLIAGAHRQSRD